MGSTKGSSEIRISPGGWGVHDAIIFSFEEVYGEMLRRTKEYTLAFIPELDEWRGDVIAYGEWVDIGQEEIDDLRTKYYLDALVNLK